jgi:xanthine/CO dehydrogenase XdhC/CoxF family maturation factor
MKELLETLDGWIADGQPAGRAVVVRTFGSAPRPEGAVLLRADDGRIAGSVSGGCVEGAAATEIERARADGHERVIRYGISDEEAWDVGLACGGTIDVLVEPFLPQAARDAAAAAASQPARGSAIVTWLPVDSPPPEHGEQRPRRVERLRHQRFDDIGAKERLIAEDEQHGIRRRGPRHRPRPTDLQRAREAAGRIRIRNKLRPTPIDARRRRVCHDHERIGEARIGERVQNVLQHRLAVDSGLELVAAETRAGAGGEDDRADPRLRRQRASAVRGAPVTPYLAATISAMIARAVSAGALPPRSSPIGPWTDAISASVRPPSASRAPRSACVFRDPIAPT